MYRVALTPRLNVAFLTHEDEEVLAIYFANQVSLINIPTPDKQPLI